MAPSRAALAPPARAAWTACSSSPIAPNARISGSGDFDWFVAPWLADAAAGRTDLQLLDCGCGTGANLAMLGRHGRAFGFDLTARGLQFAKGHGLDSVVRASIGAIPFPDASFDIVTSFDVLYGLPDEIERAAGREMARVLKPGGKLLVTSAAFDLLRGGHGTFTNEVRRYTTSSLAGFFTTAGLDVVRVSYTHATLFPILAAVRGWERWRGGGEAAASEADLRCRRCRSTPRCRRRSPSKAWCCRG